MKKNRQVEIKTTYRPQRKPPLTTFPTAAASPQSVAPMSFFAPVFVTRHAPAGWEPRGGLVRGAADLFLLFRPAQ